VKILVFNWRDIKNPEAGGAEVHLHETFRRIASRHSVTLVSSAFRGCNRVELVDDIRIIRIAGKVSFTYVAPLYYLAKLRHEDFDIVVEDISKMPLLTPVYVRKPLVAIIHMIHGRILYRELFWPMAVGVDVSERLVPLIYRNIRLVTGSGGLSLREELKHMGIAEQSITSVHTGFDASLYKRKNGLGGEPCVAYVGRVTRYKQVDHLISAFRVVKNAVPEARLVIAGKGDYKQLERLVRQLGLNRCVELIGEVSETDKVAILQKAWVVVIPSCKEGWGLSVIEANGCGTPAIAYGVPGLRDSIKDKETGLLVPSNDIGKLAQAIIEVLTDSVLLQRLSHSATRWACSFSWDKTAEEIETVLKEVAQENGRDSRNRR
jgi:glycosyltransferase involved in cell wall biosynthesis